jgi:hypothetical protein
VSQLDEADGSRSDRIFTVYVRDGEERTAGDVRTLAVALLSFVEQIEGGGSGAVRP